MSDLWIHGPNVCTFPIRTDLRILSEVCTVRVTVPNIRIQYILYYINKLTTLFNTKQYTCIK